METRSTLANTIIFFFSIGLLVLYALLLTDYVQVIILRGFSTVYFLGLICYLALFITIFCNAFLNKEDKMLYSTAIIFLSLPIFILPQVTFIDNNDSILRILFWFTVFIWTIMTLLFFSHKKKDTNYQTNILTFISVFWFSLSLFATIGSKYYTFAMIPLQDLQVANKFGDIRLLAGLFIIIIIICRAFGKTFQTPLKNVTNINRVQIPFVIKNTLAYPLKPIILVFNIILTIFIFVFNIIWNIIAFITLYMIRFLRSIVFEIYGQYYHFKYIKLLALAGIIILSFLTGFQIERLNSNLIMYFFDDKLINIILTISNILIFLIIKLALCTILFQNSSESLSERLSDYWLSIKIWFRLVIYNMIYFVIALWLTGLTLLALGHIEMLSLLNFHHIGSFTLGMSCIFPFIMVSYFILFLLSRKKHV